MENNKRPILSAQCPFCKHPIKFYQPSKPGLVKLQCRNAECQQYFSVNVDANLFAALQQAAQQKAGSQATGQQTTQPINRQPENPQPQTDPQQGGGAGASQQGKPLTEPVIKKGGSGTATMAHIEQIRGAFRKNKIFPLQLGINTIGRADNISPSTIMIEGDSTISRCSISIEVMEKANGYKYLFTLLQTTNPVIVNGTEHIAPPASYTIMPGTEIRLGMTRLILKE